MVCLGFEPGTAGWQAQMKPWSYGGHPLAVFYLVFFHSIFLPLPYYVWTVCLDIFIELFLVEYVDITALLSLSGGDPCLFRQQLCAVRLLVSHWVKTSLRVGWLRSVGSKGWSGFVRLKLMASCLSVKSLMNDSIGDDAGGWHSTVPMMMTTTPMKVRALMMFIFRSFDD